MDDKTAVDQKTGVGFLGDALKDLHIFAIRRRMGKWVVIHADKNLSAQERPYFVRKAEHRVRNLRNVDLVIVESHTPPNEYVGRLNNGEMK